MPTVARRFTVLALVLAGALGLVACGESSEEKATAKVCASTKEISAQLAKLQTLTLSSTALDEAKSGFETIGKSVNEIKDAAPNLETARKEEVTAANDAFKATFAALAAQIGSAALSSGSVEEELKKSEGALKAAVTTLATDYKKVFAELKCS
jgi:hypothetical protein